MTTMTAPAAPADRSTTGPVRAGVTAVWPLAAGYLPFALVVGAALGEQGGGPAGWAGSWLVYGGSAQLAALRSLEPAGAAVALLTGLVVNARMVLYTVSLNRRWRDQPRWFRVVASSLVIDATWALTVARDERPAGEERRFFLAVGVLLGLVWVGGIAVGTTVGAHVKVDAFDAVAPLVLVALLAPRLARRDDRTAVVVAALVVAVAGPRLPAGTGILAAVAGEVVAGELVSRRGSSGSA